MGWVQSRLVILLAAVTAAVALAIAQGGTEFGHLEVRAGPTSHSLALRSDGARTSPGMQREIRFSGDGTDMGVIFPSSPVVGSEIPVDVELRVSGQSIRGRLTADVQESGGFLGATVRGDVSGWNVNGGFRVRYRPVEVKAIPATVGSNELAHP
jgi:hypothetical protein